VKYYTTDPGAKGRFIRALRELADFLDQNMAIPVPKHGACLTLHASSADYGGRAQVDHIAKLLGAEVNDETARGGHYWAVRNFGPIGYEIVAIGEPYPASDPMPVCYQSVIPAAPPDGHS
jgi:hypothetical protein